MVMESNRSLSVRICPDSTVCIQMGPYRFLFVYMGPNGKHWVLMRL